MITRPSHITATRPTLSSCFTLVLSFLNIYKFLHENVLFPYVLKPCDDFLHLSHLLTKEIGLLLFISTFCTLINEKPCLHRKSSKKNGAINLKHRSHDHDSINSKQLYAEGSVTKLNVCYKKSVDNFRHTLVNI